MKQQNYSKLEKKIACVIAKLPSEHLRDLAETQKQLNLWFAVRWFQEQVSQCWEARFRGLDDPLFPLLRSEQITLDTHQRVWLVVNFYEQLWGLVQLATPYIQAEFEGSGLEYLAESAFVLFTRLIRSEVDSDFAVCLKPYHEVSSRKYERAYRLAVKGCQEGLKSREERILHRILNQHQPNVLLSFVLAVCHLKATRTRPALKSKLEMFYIALGKLCEKEAAISRKAGSFAWKKGRIVEGSRYGGTYSNA